MYDNPKPKSSIIIDGYDESSLVKDPQALKTVTDVVKHRENVKNRLMFLADELYKRAEHHDDSKLAYPEIEWLIEMDKEPRYDYGTPEYFDKMKRWQKFFDHHYKNNRHHPDHFTNGIDDMNLVDLCEYVIDIISYFNELHVHDALETINKQSGRFGFDEQLEQILKNTLLNYFSWFGDIKPLSQKNHEDIKITKIKPKEPLGIRYKA